MNYIVNNPIETYNLAEKTAKEILDKNGPVVIGLEGDLGAGKTTFIKGFAKGLQIKDNIISPTFVIMNKYKIKDRNFYHFDCYRIEKEKEMDAIGFNEIISSDKNIVCVEWSNNIKKKMPKNAIIIKFTILGENKRKINFVSYGG